MPVVAPMLDAGYDGFFKAECEAGWSGSGKVDPRGFKEVDDWAQPWYLSTCINAGEWQTLDALPQLAPTTVKYGWEIGKAATPKWLELTGLGLGNTTTLPTGATQARWARYTTGLGIVDNNGQAAGRTPPGWYLQTFENSITSWINGYEQPGVSGWTYPGWSTDFYTYANSTALLKGIQRTTSARAVETPRIRTARI
jgi:hypothetical protein